MAQRPLRVRALLFLYSSANIAGCATALLGPALLFGGVIDKGWGLITAGLYAVGWLLGRRPPELERRIEDGLTVAQTLDRLDDVIARARPHLLPDMAQHLASIRTSVAEILPRLVGNQHFDQDLFTVRETVLRYLPETLANYVALPPTFRVQHPLQAGKTARQLLGEQLTVLDDKMREIAANVAASDAQALLANGRFLEAKFRQPDFLSH